MRGEARSYDPDTRDKLLEFIRGYVAEFGVMPTFQEMGDAVGFAKSMIRGPLDLLVAEGKLGRSNLPGRRTAYFYPQRCHHCGDRLRPQGGAAIRPSLAPVPPKGASLEPATRNPSR